jgi:cell division protein FtsX
MPRTKLKVEIDADSAKFNRRMKALSATVAGVGIAIAAVGVAASVAFVRMASDVAKANDELGKSAKRLQVTNDELQQLNLLANLSGFSLKSVETAFIGLGRKVLELKRGLSAAKEEFALIGLDESSFGANTFDNFKVVLKELEKIEDKQIRLGLATRFLGRSGSNFLAAIADGAGSLDDALSRVAKNRAFFISNKEIARAESMNDQISEFQLGFKKVKSVIASETFPAFEDLAKSATEFVNQMLMSNEFPALLKAVKTASEDVAKTLKSLFKDVEMDDFIENLTEIFRLVSAISKLLNETGLIDFVSKFIGTNVAGNAKALKNTREVAQGLGNMEGIEISGAITDFWSNLISGEDIAKTKIGGFFSDLGKTIPNDIGEIKRIITDKLGD